jgi:hypothetical protein
MPTVDPLNPLSPRNSQQQIHQDSTTSNPLSHQKTKSDQSDQLNEVEHEYSEGYENVLLPSKGLFYFGDAKHIEALPVRPFDYSDEDILSTPSFYENGNIYTELLNNVILAKTVLTAKNLVPIDRDTILIWLRSTSFGNDFKIEYKCPKCKMGSGEGIKEKGGEMSWDLNKLEIPQYSKEVYEELYENGEIKVVTPLTQTKVRITVPTTSVIQSLEKKFALKKEKEKIKKDFYATITLLSIVSGVELDDGKVEREKNKIDQYFRKIHLPIKDSRFLIEQAGDLNLNYETAQNFVCKDCGHIVEGVEMPIMHRYFFWPES